MEWEQIDDWHSRAKVFGGWLVKALEPVVHDNTLYGHGMMDVWDFRVAMAFVPDANHEWTIL